MSKRALGTEIEPVAVAVPESVPLRAEPVDEAVGETDRQLVDRHIDVEGLADGAGRAQRAVTDLDIRLVDRRRAAGIAPGRIEAQRRGARLGDLARRDARACEVEIRLRVGQRAGGRRCAGNRAAGIEVGDGNRWRAPTGSCRRSTLMSSIWPIVPAADSEPSPTSTFARWIVAVPDA